MNTLTQAIRENWANLSDRAQARAIRTKRIPVDQWKLIEEGHHYDTITAATADEALEQARSNVDSSNYDYSETIWVDVRVRNVYTGDDARDSVQCDVAEPNCEDGHEHNWRSPYSVLGGLKENPGVRGNGGGVIIKEVCAHCGKYRVTNTWTQRRDTGEQGLRSVRYEDVDDASREWVESLTDEFSGVV